jgi:hypothetical protein
LKLHDSGLRLPPENSIDSQSAVTSPAQRSLQTPHHITGIALADGGLSWVRYNNTPSARSVGPLRH